jgi:hypothetical protein
MKPVTARPTKINRNVTRAKKKKDKKYQVKPSIKKYTRK